LNSFMTLEASTRSALVYTHANYKELIEVNEGLCATRLRGGN
jgi:hypothetical protein